MSRIVAFKVKNSNNKILFACLVGWVNSSTTEIKKKIKEQILIYGLSCVKTDVSARLYLHAQLWGPQSLAHCVHWIPTESTWAGARYWIYLLFTCVLLKGVPQKIRFLFLFLLSRLPPAMHKGWCEPKKIIKSSTMLSIETNYLIDLDTW